MLRRTQLYGYHSAHAKLTEFAGFEMPLWYTTTKEEHLAVRNNCGIFDVSHMGRFEVTGEGSTTFLESLLPTWVAKQNAGKAFYTLLLDESAGIMDDLIVMRLGRDRYILVVNAANAASDMRHLVAHKPPAGVEINDKTQQSAMVAIQGPRSAQALQALTDVDLSGLRRFRCAEGTVLGQPSFVSRTGYTGEDGFEVIVSGATEDDPRGALKVWEGLAAASTPCGLGARDSLRLEAGFPLHGSDIDQSTDPIEADLTWVISQGKSGYVGSDALLKRERQPPGTVRRGIMLEEGIPRHGFEVLDGTGAGPVGVVTSGTFSPILQKGIALSKIERSVSDLDTHVSILVRGERKKARVARLPFYDESAYGWKRASK